MSAVGRTLRAWRPNRTTVVLAGVGLVAEALFAVAYLAGTRPTIARPLFVVLVPFLWLNLALWVFLRVRPAAQPGTRWPAVVAIAYFGVLAVFGGIVSPGGTGGAGFRVLVTGFPGWVPLVVVDATLLTMVLVPFKLVGYLALSYLVYVTVVDAAGALLGSAVGLFSCVSCTFPLIAGLVTTIAGGGAVAAAVYSNAYLLSTVVYAVTVVLLVWQPSPASLARLLDVRNR